MNKRALYCLIWGLIILGPSAVAQEPACTACHQGHTAGPVHEALGQSCEACHGPGSEHATRPTEASVLTFQDEPANARNAACTGCHVEAHPPGASAHESAGVACNDCHKIHTGTDQTSQDTERAGFERIDRGSRVCSGCHESVLAEFQLSERHRLQENVLGCTSCHDPHGRSKHAALGGARDEACIDCHAAQDGPFVFEHDASRIDGCSACHAHHGSPNRHLLAHQDVGELCYSCHATVPQFHLGFAPVGEPRFGTDTVCTNCHVTIHGSNIDRNFLQ